MSEHHHHHHHAVGGKNLFITIILNVIITLSQIVGGLMSGSLALLSDAVHNFSDVMALVIAYVANRMAARPNTYAHTFGYKRAEILAALFNATVLVAIALFLISEAFYKFYHPEPIDSTWVIALGLLSILLNAVSVLLIKDDAHGNMNIRAAYLHLLTDVMTSVAVVVGGVLMYYFELFWVDPLISMLIAFYLIWASIGLIKESAGVLMQFTPTQLDITEIINTIKELAQVEDVHHLHLWRLDDKGIHLEAHLGFAEDLTLGESNKVLDRLEMVLKEQYHICHTTFQCEYRRCENRDDIRLKG